MNGPGINDLPPWFSELKKLQAENARFRRALDDIVSECDADHKGPTAARIAQRALAPPPDQSVLP
jgi:hypothetical protein